jgi:hypothetical protein
MKVEKHLLLLKFLATASDDQRVALIKRLSETQVKVILESIYNVLFGTCPIEVKDKKTLKSQSTVIRRMVSKELTLLQKRRLLKKHQRLLPLLLKPVVDMFD